MLHERNAGTNRGVAVAEHEQAHTLLGQRCGCRVYLAALVFAVGQQDDVLVAATIVDEQAIANLLENSLQEGAALRDTAGPDVFYGEMHEVVIHTQRCLDGRRASKDNERDAGSWIAR